MSDPERCFVDSNVWLYAFIAGQDTAKSATAATLLQKGSVAISVQVINEVCVNLIRNHAMPEADLRDLIESFFIKYFVVPLERHVLTHASELRERYSISFWDSSI